MGKMQFPWSLERGEHAFAIIRRIKVIPLYFIPRWVGLWLWAFHFYLFELFVQLWEDFQEVILVLVGGAVQVFKGKFEQLATFGNLAQIGFGSPRAQVDFGGDEVARGVVHRLSEVILVIGRVAVDFAASLCEGASAKSSP